MTIMNQSITNQLVIDKEASARFWQQNYAKGDLEKAVIVQDGAHLNLNLTRNTALGLIEVKK